LKRAGGPRLNVNKKSEASGGETPGGGEEVVKTVTETDRKR